MRPINQAQISFDSRSVNEGSAGRRWRRSSPSWTPLWRT